MLQFTNKKINRIDDSFTEMVQAGLGHIATEAIDANKHTLVINGKPLVNFALNSALGLETDERVTNAFNMSAQRFGMSFIMSRLFASPPQFLEFESLLNQIFESYPVVMSSTTLAHLAALPVLIQENDIVIIDQYVHNSVRMAFKTVDAKTTSFTVPHNNLERIEQLIQRYHKQQNINNIWYLADGVYSMLGEPCPINDLLRLLNKYENFYAYVDDAHGMSITGKHGRGYVLGHCDKQHEKLIVAISFSKSFGMGCGGAIICPNPHIQRKIKTCGNTWIYSSPVPIPMLSAGIALANIHLSDEIHTLQTQLNANTLYFQSLAIEHNIPLSSINESTHINYVIVGSTGKTIAVTKKILADGFFITYCPYPVVPKALSGIRVLITAKHSKHEIKGFVTSLAKHLHEQQ